MFKKLTLSTLTAVALSAGSALAAGGAGYVHDEQFSFEGPFGKFDQNQLQRGLQVYTEVCSSCHGLKYVPLRTLSDEGGPHLPEDQVRAYAEQNFETYDEELEDFRPSKPTDFFPESNDPNAPDLSLMTKARAGFHGPYGTGISQLVNGMGGAEYVASILTGYNGKEKEEAGTVFYGNDAFPGGWIAMAPVLGGGIDGGDFGDERAVEHIAKIDDADRFVRLVRIHQYVTRIGILVNHLPAQLLQLRHHDCFGMVEHPVANGLQIGVG